MMAIARRAAPLLLLAVMAVCAPTAAARDDEEDFALKLAERGYDALANRVIDRMVAGSPTPEKKGGAEFARCELLARTARLAAAGAMERNPPTEVRAKFSAAVKAYDNFAKAYASHRRKSDAEFGRVKLNTDFAYYLQLNLDRFPAAEKESVYKEALKIFEDAIADLAKLKEREDEALKAAEAPQDPDEAEKRAFPRNFAWYNLCVALHDRAMLLPPGDPLRTQHFTRAIEETNLLLEETDGYIIGFYASMYLGLCHWHRADAGKSFDKDDIKQAATWFRSVIDNVDIQDLDANWPPCAHVVRQALAHFGAMCNAVGGSFPVVGVPGVTDYRQYCVNTVSRVEGKLPSVRSDRFGLRAVIEKGRALSALGQHQVAVETLDHVSGWALAADPTWGRSVDQEAKRALNDAIAAIPSEANLQVAPDVLFKAAEGSLRDGAVGRAIRVYQRVLLAIDNESNPGKRKALADEFSTKCWTQINECYARQSRWLEAFYAADVPVRQYLAAGRTDEDEDVARLAYYRMTALQSLVQQARPDEKPALSGRLEEARKLLADKFPSASTGTLYGVAGTKLSQAKTLRDDPVRAEAAFREAIDTYRKIGEKDVYFRMAQARIGEALVSSGKVDEGLRFLQEFVRKSMEFWNASDTPARERQSWGWCLLWIATALDTQKQHAKVVETLEGFEDRFGPAGLSSAFPQIRELRAGALTRVGRGDEAEKVVRLMIQESPDAPQTSRTALVVANDVQARGAKASQAGERKAAADLRKRALELYDFWLAHFSGVTADNYYFVGQLHDWAGDDARASELYTKALKLYEDAGDAESAEKVKVLLSGLLVSQGKYAEALPQFEDLFVKTPESVEPLRDLFNAMNLVPARVEVGVHREKVKKELGRIADALAKDPVGATLAPEARRAASGAGTSVETEMLIRIFADKPETRRALARAAAFTILGESAELVAEVKVAAFNLVKRQTELMSNLARCYEELWLAESEYGIRSINLYGTLIDSAPPLDEKDTPGARYTERWFDWKFRMTRLYLNIGTKYQLAPALKYVCGIYKSMETVKELERADKVRENFQKEFLSLKDQAHAALLKMNQEGCK